MNPLHPASVIRLAPGCRMSDAEGQEDVLLIPEGALQLKGPARVIVGLCNGERALAGIVAELQSLFPDADAERIEADTAALLTRLIEKGALESV